MVLTFPDKTWKPFENVLSFNASFADFTPQPLIHENGQKRECHNKRPEQWQKYGLITPSAILARMSGSGPNPGMHACIWNPILEHTLQTISLNEDEDSKVISKETLLSCLSTFLVEASSSPIYV